MARDPWEEAYATLATLRRVDFPSWCGGGWAQVVNSFDDPSL